MSDRKPRIEPRNLSAQIRYRGRGNPPVSHPDSAISNCFPGLEFDFRAIWRRVFEGIVLHESNNYVVEAEDPALKHLCGCRLLKIEGRDVVVKAVGPRIPGRDPVTLGTSDNRNAVAFMEWSNTIALIRDKQGDEVQCTFTAKPSETEVLAEDRELRTQVVKLRMRRLFADFGAGIVPVLAEELAHPGELSQGLCSPWQNDYRECACYYWAASRPDYVNVVAADDGSSRGDNWMQKKRTGDYLPDDRADSRLVSYDDLFREWERVLRFVIGGSTEPGPEER